MVVNTIVLDAGPLITQSFSELSTLAENFVTTPSVHSEIKDERARQNLILWGDRLVLRQPKPEYVKIVTEFSKKTGDYFALSSTDLHIIALCYEMECELNNGDWRLRKYPGQKTINANANSNTKDTEKSGNPVGESKPESQPESDKPNDEPHQSEQQQQDDEEDDGFTVVTKKKNNRKKQAQKEEPMVEVITDFDDEDDEGWIGPEDDEQTAKNQFGSSTDERPAKQLKAAMSSGDFAMQNVALQIGLNLVNPTNGMHIKKVKNYMLRCHACFKLSPLPKDGKPLQFCPKCGLNTLLRCSVSVGDNGKMQIHLKKNMTWITRGNKYSLPNPQSKSARRQQRPDPNPILLREDQKEYQRAVKDDMWKKRHNEKILDEWIGSGSADNVMTPFAISGYKRDATRHSGVRVGQGRNVNAVKKKIA